jgi:hypothetical protein
VATFSERETHLPWSGTIEDVMRLARMTDRLIAEEAREDDEGNRATPYFTATMQRPRREDRFGSPDELERDGLNADLDEVDELYLNASTGGLEPRVRAYVSFGKRGVFLSVEGSSQVAVHGVASTLRRETSRRRRRAGWLYMAPWALLGPVIGLPVAAAIQLAIDHRTAGLVLMLASIGLFVAMGVFLAINRTRPAFALRRPEQPPRPSLVRRGSFWLASAIGTALVSIAVAALVRLV